MVLLLFQHTYLPISMWKLTIKRKVISKMAPASSHSSGYVSTVGSTKGGSVGILKYQWMSAPFHFGQPTTSGTLQVECFQPPLDTLGELCFLLFPLLHLVLSKFLVEHVTGQFTLLILVTPWQMEAPCLPTVLSILEDTPHQCPIIGKTWSWMFC